MQEKPKSSEGDLAHATLRGALGTIPYVGSIATELFSAIFTPPLTKRRDEWIASIAEDLKSLAVKVERFRIENLSDNESFVSTALHATHAAIRTHQKEKLDALRNAVLNAALDPAPDEDLQLIFLNFVDTFTPWHLRILNYFDEHPSRTESGYSSGDLFNVHPALEGRAAFYEQIVRDLYARGLVTSNVTPGTFTAFMPFAGTTTALGKTFLKFITSPL